MARGAQSARPDKATLRLRRTRGRRVPRRHKRRYRHGRGTASGLTKEDLSIVPRRRRRHLHSARGGRSGGGRPQAQCGGRARSLAGPAAMERGAEERGEGPEGGHAAAPACLVLFKEWNPCQPISLSLSLSVSLSHSLLLPVPLSRAALRPRGRRRRAGNGEARRERLVFDRSPRDERSLGRSQRTQERNRDGRKRRKQQRRRYN